MEIEDEIGRLANALKEQLASAAELPVFREMEWVKDFHVAITALSQMRAQNPDLPIACAESSIEDEQLVARAARMADLMAAERKARRAAAGTETTQ